jgi:hypothetical protein
MIYALRVNAKLRQHHAGTFEYLYALSQGIGNKRQPNTLIEYAPTIERCLPRRGAFQTPRTAKTHGNGRVPGSSTGRRWNVCTS